MKDKRIKGTEQQKLREHIWPIVAFAEKHRGFETVLLERLIARCGSRPPSRQALNEWLRRDPAKRKQPRFSMGLILVEEARKLMGSWDEHVAKLADAPDGIATRRGNASSQGDAGSSPAVLTTKKGRS